MIAPRLSRLRAKTGRKTFPALNFFFTGRKTQPALNISGPGAGDKSGPETSLALRQVRPWDKSGPETCQVRPYDKSRQVWPRGKSGPKTCQDKSGPKKSLDMSSPKTFLAMKENWPLLIGPIFHSRFGGITYHISSFWIRPQKRWHYGTKLFISLFLLASLYWPFTQLWWSQMLVLKREPTKIGHNSRMRNFWT